MKHVLTPIAVCAASLAIPASAALDTNRIEQVTGLKGAWNASEGVFKVSQPRNDVAAKADQWKMPPFMGLTSWAAFLAGKKADAMVMGDLVLTLIIAQASAELRARTYGAYYLIRDCVVTLGSFLGAWLWAVGPKANFLGAAVCGALGTIWFWWFVSRSQKTTSFKESLQA